MSQEIQAKIRQRRAQMLIHSRLYYILDDPVVDDDTWQRWADELRDLQDSHPSCCGIKFYDNAFLGWTGDTGYHLPLKDEWVVDKTRQVYDRG